MKRWSIAYSGDTTVTVEAETKEKAEEIFWEEGLNDLYDSEIGDIVELNNLKGEE